MTGYERRLALLREEMRKEQIDYYLINANDPHQSAHVAKYWQAVQ